jgi:hypothetical protein
LTPTSKGKSESSLQDASQETWYSQPYNARDLEVEYLGTRTSASSMENLGTGTVMGNNPSTDSDQGCNIYSEVNSTEESQDYPRSYLFCSLTQDSRTSVTSPTVEETKENT